MFAGRTKLMGERAVPAAIPSRPTNCAGRASNAKFMLQSTSPHRSRRGPSWVVASVVLLVMAIAFGAPWITVVALKDIAAEVNGERSIPALAGALMWVGSGFGGILMGRIAERVGVRWTVMFGAAMIAFGLALSTLGPSWPLYIGHGLFIGLIGIGGINAPFYVYVSRWFDRRRGSALALISSGAYLAGAIWPPIFERAIAYVGWRHTMLYYAAFELVVIVPRRGDRLGAAAGYAASRARVTEHAHAQNRSWAGRPISFSPCRCAAIFTCCMPMSMPQGHLVAFCSDLGISAGARRGDAVGAARRGVLEPPGVGRDLRSDRRALHDAGRLGLPGGRHGGVSVDAGRSSACSRSRRCSAWASAVWFRPMCWPRANCFRSAKPIGGCRRCCCAAARAWRRAAGSPACSTIISAFTRRPSPPALGVNMLNFMIISTLAFRRSQTAPA